MKFAMLPKITNLPEGGKPEICSGQLEIQQSKKKKPHNKKQEAQKRVCKTNQILPHRIQNNNENNTSPKLPPSSQFMMLK